MRQNQKLIRFSFSRNSHLLSLILVDIERVIFRGMLRVLRKSTEIWRQLRIRLKVRIQRVDYMKSFIRLILLELFSRITIRSKESHLSKLISTKKSHLRLTWKTLPLLFIKFFHFIIFIIFHIKWAKSIKVLKSE